MNKIIELSYSELLMIEGGCQTCHSRGKRLGQEIQESTVWVAVESGAKTVWKKVKSWFN